MKHSAIHPKQVQESDGLVLYESKFGTNWVLGGAHERLQGTDRLDKTAATIAHAEVNNVRVMFDMYLDSGIDFFTSEDFGVKVVPQCEKCKGCKNCTYDVHMMSKEEKHELNIIENNLQLCPIEKKWTTSYPYKVDPSILVDNESQINSLVNSTENRLLKSPENVANYNEAFRDFVSRGVHTLLTEEEMNTYQGPVHYASQHEVIKPTSTSTPRRIVTNSSLQCDGKSLNDILMKGPTTLNDLLVSNFASVRIALLLCVTSPSCTTPLELRNWRNIFGG